MAATYGTDEWEAEYQALLSKRKEKPPPYIYFTPEWVDLYEKAIKQDAAYREAAKDWEGSVVLHVLKDPEFGVDLDLYLFLDLWHGECRSLRVVPEEVGMAADFVITGTLARWTLVGKKELDTTKGMMQGKLRLKGDLPTIVRSIRASQRLTDISAEVGGLFADELNDEQIEGTRALIKEMREKLLG